MTSIVDDKLYEKWLKEEYEHETVSGIPIHTRENANSDILPTASEARDRVDSNIKRNLNDIMRPVVNKINKAISEMRNFCYIDTLTEIQKKQLEIKEYKVKYYPNTSGDPRERSQYKISW